MILALHDAQLENDLVTLALVCVGLGILGLVIRAAIRSARRDATGTPDGPGTFRVAGVVRNTGADTRVNVQAESSANARVKAELQGIVVTSVERA